MAKVLIVDDEPEIRRMLTKIVREAGHEAFEAHDGAEVLSQIKDQIQVAMLGLSGKSSEHA